MSAVAVAARDGAVADEVEANGIGVTSQKYLPGTRLVRAFNTMSYKIFASEANRPDPKLAVLRDSPRLFLAVRIHLTGP